MRLTYNVARARTGTLPTLAKVPTPRYASSSVGPSTTARSARPRAISFRLSADADVTSAVASTLGTCRAINWAIAAPYT
jgi:hypothetical protein